MSSESFMFLSTLKREDVWWKTSSHEFKFLTVGTTQQNLWVGIKAKVWVSICTFSYLSIPTKSSKVQPHHTLSSRLQSDSTDCIIRSYEFDHLPVHWLSFVFLKLHYPTCQHGGSVELVAFWLTHRANWVYYWSY